MVKLFLKAALIFGLVFGSAGGVVFASADSLPNSPIYPVKLATEQIRLALTSDPAGKAALHLELVHERVQEMARLAEVGEEPDEATWERLQSHLDKGLQLGVQLSDESLLEWLSQATDVTEDGVRRLVRKQDRDVGTDNEPLRRAAAAMKKLGQAAEDGLHDPMQFRYWYKRVLADDTLLQVSSDGDPETEWPGRGEPGAHGPGEPGGNPEAPCESGDCEPVGDQHQYGEPGAHGPGEPGGNPEAPCESDDCEPVGDQNQYGEPGAYGPGEPGGNPEAPCESGDCEPVGDQNQYRESGSHGSSESQSDAGQGTGKGH
jgi:hypothetical protein